ncbi:MAG: murein hydrolase activator EnvC family protein [Gammaproteobacteria bacterium]
MRTRRFIILFSIFCTLGSGNGWSENETGNKKRQLEALEHRIRALQATLDELENKKNSLRAELRDNERSYGALSNALKRLNDEIAASESNLATVRGKRDSNRRKLAGFEASLVKQIRATHAMGRQERLQLLLNQKDPLKVGRVLNYFDYFNNIRATEIRQIHAIQEDLRQSEEELSAGNERLKRLRSERESEAKSLEASLKARKRLLAGLDRDYRDRNTELKQLKQDEAQLRLLIKSIEQAAREVPFQPESKTAFSKLQGHLRWPVQGKLVQSFGSKTPAGRFNGVLISAREGEPVKAVSAGRVVYADWLVRYGLLMIVDHGKGFMTLYAYNQSLQKSLGDSVQSGEQIATVGRSGGRSVPGLYFEVRKNGKPVNPLEWCEKISTRHAG